MTRRDLIVGTFLCFSALVSWGHPPAASAVSFEEHPVTGLPGVLKLGRVGGTLYVTGALAGHALGRVSATGAVSAIPNTGEPGTSVTVGPDGNPWWIGTSTIIAGGIPHGFPAIYELTPAGASLKIQMPLEIWHGMPQAMTMGSDGALWFTGPYGFIDRYAPYVGITEYPIPIGPSYVSSITAGSDGSLWFTDKLDGEIGRITVAGNITEWPLADAPFAEPEEIVTGSDGAEWFTARHLGRIGRITSAGQISEYTVPVKGSGPQSLTQGPEGAIWFTDPGSPASPGSADAIGRITPDGTITEYPLPNLEEVPNSIAIGPEGAIWFTEENPAKIARLNLTGPTAPVPAPASAKSAHSAKSHLHACLQSAQKSSAKHHVHLSTAKSRCIGTARRAARQRRSNRRA